MMCMLCVSHYFMLYYVYIMSRALYYIISYDVYTMCRSLRISCVMNIMCVPRVPARSWRNSSPKSFCIRYTRMFLRVCVLYSTLYLVYAR